MRRFLLAGLLLSCCRPVVAQEAAAWVTQPVGEVEVRRAGEGPWAPLTSDHVSLAVGDEVRTGALSRAVILLRSTDRVQLGAQSRYRVEETTAREGEGLGGTLAALTRNAWNRVIGRSSAVATGAARATDDDAPILERPRYGLVLATRPTVQWLASPSHEGTYHVRLLQDSTGSACLDGPDSGPVVWDVEGVADTTLQYPADQAALHPGAAYSVEVRRQGDAAASDWGCITVATEAEQAELASAWAEIQAQYGTDDTAEITAELVYAALLFDQGYYADALNVLDAAECKQPGDATVARLRAFVYEEAGPPILIDPGP